MAQVASELISITNNQKLADSKYIKDLELGDKKQSDINKDSLAGGVYNVTKFHSLLSEYYTITTAIAAIPQALRCVGMVITYQTASDSWETKQFKGALSDWTDSSKWEDFGGGEAGDGVYDISKANNETQYSSLQEAVAAIPSGVGKGGMEIKYIDSNSGKYRQFRLVTPYFGTPSKLVNLNNVTFRQHGVNTNSTADNPNDDTWSDFNTGYGSKRLVLVQGKRYIVKAVNSDCVLECLKQTDSGNAGTSVVYANGEIHRKVALGGQEIIDVPIGSDKYYLNFRADTANSDDVRKEPIIYIEDIDNEYAFNADDWVEYSAANDTPSGASANIEIDTASIKRLSISIDSNTKKWATASTGYGTKFLILSKGCTYRLFAESKNTSLGLLNERDTHQNGTDVLLADKCEWHALYEGESEVFHVAEDSDKYYLAFRADTLGNNANSVLHIYKSINNAETEGALTTIIDKKTITYRHNTSHASQSTQFKPNCYDSTIIGFKLGKKYRIRAMVSDAPSANISFYLRKIVTPSEINPELSFNLGCTISSDSYVSSWVYYTPSDTDNQYISSYINQNDYNTRYIIEVEELDVNEVIADDTRLLNKALKVYTKQDVGLENYTFADIVVADNNYYKVNNSSGVRVIVQLPVLPTNIKLTFNSGYKVSIHQWNLKGAKLLQNINSNDDVFLSSGFWFMSDIEIGRSTDETDIREDANTVFLCIAKTDYSTLSLQDAYDNVNFEIVGNKVDLSTYYNYSGFISLGNRGFTVKKVLNIYSEQPLNMQGADCYNGYLVIGSAKGTLNVFDIEDGSLIGTIQVPAIDGETGRYPHFNTLKFAKNLHSGNNHFPYIYASEGRHNQDEIVEVDEDRIFVYDLAYNGTTFTLTEVQRYNTNLLRGITEDKDISRVSSSVGLILDFALDEDGGYLYLIGNKNWTGYDNRFVWSKVRLHAVSEGDITIPTEELIDVWESKGYPARQGCFYWQGLAYVLAGQFDYNPDDSNPLTKAHNYMMAMNVGTKVQQAEVDLAQFMIDLSSLATANGANEEPEAIFVYNNKTYILSYSTEKNGQNVSLHSRFYLYEVSFDSSGYNSNSQSTIGRVSNLDGKTIVALGDSSLRNILTTAPGGSTGDEITWLRKIAIKHGMEYTNYGVGGNAMVSPVDTSDPKVDPMVVRYTNLPNAADYVLVIGGRNDYKQQPTCSFENFKDGIRTLCEGLITKYVNSGAKICFFTCWQPYKHGEDPYENNATHSQEEYADAIEEVCNEYSIPCFNSRKKSGLYMFDVNFRTKYCINSGDRSHLNAAGHDYFMPRAEAFLESL